MNCGAVPVWAGGTTGRPALAWAVAEARGSGGRLQTRKTDAHPGSELSEASIGASVLVVPDLPKLAVVPDQLPIVEAPAPAPNEGDDCARRDGPVVVIAPPTGEEIFDAVSRAAARAPRSVPGPARLGRSSRLSWRLATAADPVEQLGARNPGIGPLGAPLPGGGSVRTQGPGVARPAGPAPGRAGRMATYR